jgi:hypothetical protein
MAMPAWPPVRASSRRAFAGGVDGDGARSGLADGRGLAGGVVLAPEHDAVGEAFFLVRQVAELVIDDVAGQRVGAFAAGLCDQLLFARRAGDGLTLTQQDLAGGGLGSQFLRARLAGRRRTQAVFRRHVRGAVDTVRNSSGVTLVRPMPWRTLEQAPSASMEVARGSGRRGYECAYVGSTPCDA